MLGAHMLYLHIRTIISKSDTQSVRLTKSAKGRLTHTGEMETGDAPFKRGLGKLREVQRDATGYTLKPKRVNLV